MSERNGKAPSVTDRIGSLEQIRPLDTQNGERWYPISQNARTVLQTVFCRSVNMILRQRAAGSQLMDWIKTHGLHADRIRDDKAREGKRIDWAVQDLHGGKTLQAKDYQVGTWKALLSYREFREREAGKLLAIQSTVHSTRHLIAGTLDQINETPDGLCLDDIKFTKYVYDEHFDQVQTYSYLANQMGIPVKTVRIVRLGAKTKKGYELRTQEYDPELFDSLVIPLLELWDHQNGGRTQPVIERLPETLSLGQPVHERNRVSSRGQ